MYLSSTIIINCCSMRYLLFFLFSGRSTAARSAFDTQSYDNWQWSEIGQRPPVSDYALLYYFYRGPRHLSLHPRYLTILISYPLSPAQASSPVESNRGKLSGLPRGFIWDIRRRTWYAEENP